MGWITGRPYPFECAGCPLTHPSWDIRSLSSPTDQSLSATWRFQFRALLSLCCFLLGGKYRADPPPPSSDPPHPPPPHGAGHARSGSPHKPSGEFNRGGIVAVPERVGGGDVPCSTISHLIVLPPTRRGGWEGGGRGIRPFLGQGISFHCRSQTYDRWHDRWRDRWRGFSGWGAGGRTAGVTADCTIADVAPTWRTAGSSTAPHRDGTLCAGDGGTLKAYNMGGVMRSRKF